MPPLKALTQAEVSAKLGIPATRLRRWRERGLVVPSAKTACQHRYTDADMRRLVLLRILLESPRTPRWASLDKLHAEVEAMIAVTRTEAIHIGLTVAR